MAWVKVATTADLPVGSMMRVSVDEEEIALYHLEDGWCATSDVCTHAGESLTCGRLDGHVVACPKHGGKFDVRTGAAVAFPCVVPLTTYAVEVRGEDVYIDV